METTAYDRRWDTLVAPKEKDRPAHSLKEGLIFSGNNSFDVNRLICSEYGQKIIDGMEPFFLSTDPMDPKVVAYWREKGLKKEMVRGGPQEWNMWTIFTPVSAELPENAGRK